MKKNLVFFVLALFCLSRVNAQSKESARENSTVIIFNEGSSATKKKKVKRSSESSIIKIAPLGFISGTFPVLFERRITDFFSVQAGAGLTHRNYWKSIMQEASNENGSYIKNVVYPWGSDNSSTYDEAENRYSYDYRKAKMGFMATIQPRIYISNEGLDGYFIGFSYNYYKYNFEIPRMGYTNGGSLTYPTNSPLQQEYEKLTDFMVHFGGQMLNDRISVEYTTELGIRKTNGAKYAAGEVNNNSGGKTLVDGMATYSGSSFNFNIGFKIGYHF